MVKSIPIVPSPLLFLSSLRMRLILAPFRGKFWRSEPAKLARTSKFFRTRKSEPARRPLPAYTTLLPTDGCWGIEPHSFPHIIQSRFSSLFLEGVRVMFAVVWLLQSHLCFHRYLMCGPYLGVLRNDTKNGCKADYTPPSICIFWVFVKSYFSTIQIGHLS